MKIFSTREKPANKNHAFDHIMDTFGLSQKEEWEEELLDIVERFEHELGDEAMSVSIQHAEDKQQRPVLHTEDKQQRAPSRPFKFERQLNPSPARPPYQPNGATPFNPAPLNVKMKIDVFGRRKFRSASIKTFLNFLEHYG